MFYLCVYEIVSVHMYVQVSWEARVLYPLELEIQRAVSHLMWALETIPLDELQGLLMAEPSLQPSIYVLCTHTTCMLTN